MTFLRHLGFRRDRLPWEVGRPQSVLFVCRGNILRSPMAAALYRRELASNGRGDEDVFSAGLIPPGGRPADPRGRRLAPAFGVSLEDHSSQVVTEDLVARADLIVAMDRDNEARLVARFPNAGRKLVLLGLFAPERGDPVIPDPFSGTEEVVAACYARIERAVQGLAEALRRQPPVPLQSAGPMKQLARATLTHPWVMARAEAASRGHAAILLLHRFSRFEHGADGFPAPALRRHLAWLRGRRYNLAPLGDLVTAYREGRPTPPRTVAFTVDDGYADFAEVAAPVFAEFDCPVTVFLVTDFLDGRSWLWWDRLRYAFATSARHECTVELGGQPFTVAWDTPIRRAHAGAKLIDAIKWYPVRQRDALIKEAAFRLEIEFPTRPRDADAPMSWDTVRRLAGSGISFGPHSCSHPIHSAEDSETSRREIASSWQRVREEVPDALPIYCYPNGDDRSFGAREIAFLPELGIQAGISARPDYLSIGTQPATPKALGAIPRFSFDADPVRFMQVASGIERLKLRWRP